MGTDAGTPFNFHGKNLSELVHLVEAGYSPLEALQAGTGISAEIVGSADEVGTIEEGKLADLVVMGGKSPRRHLFGAGGRKHPDGYEGGGDGQGRLMEGGR